MGREVNRLSARRVQTLADIGRHADGGGLYLVVDAAGAKRWVLLYRLSGKRREMGLGPLVSVSLARARELAAEARTLIAGGVDPIEARRTQPERPAPAVAAKTFGDVALDYMEAQGANWRNPVHRRQWRQTLEVQAASLWTKPVAMVDTEAVLHVLKPLWQTKPETAKRMRGRIERVLNAARAAGHRSGENPAIWRGHLDFLLPKTPKLVRGHHPALPYAEVPKFVAAIQKRPAMSARALEFIILTASRSNEVRGMAWGEVDFAQAVWTVPAERMKMKRPHRVPLSAQALAVLARVRTDAAGDDAFVFPNRSGQKLSDMAFEALLRRTDDTEITTHGFRSSFRDWAGDETDHPREVIEAALAHLVGDATEMAYRRSDALTKRRALMDHWGAFAGSKRGQDRTNSTKSS